MHAAVITAYKDYPTLVRLVRSLRAEHIAVYIHVDAKSRFGEAQLAELRTLARLVVRRHTIYWGSYSHLTAILDLVRAALADPAVTYLHVVSGQDFPVGTLVDAVDPQAIHMDVEPIDEAPEVVRDRVRYRNLLHRGEGLRWLYRPLNKAQLAVQRVLGCNRRATRTYGNIFKGLVWLSMPREAARHCVEDRQARQLLRELRDYYLPEEFFFQTVLMNSPFRQQISPSRRFTLWEERYGVIPGILDLDDLAAIRQTDSLFARKIDSRISAALLDALDAARRQALA